MQNGTRRCRFVGFALNQYRQRCVSGHDRVGSQKLHGFRHGGRHDESVERISMMRFEILHRDGVLRRNRQFNESTLEAVLANFFQINAELPQANLDRNFPEARGADIDFCGVVYEHSRFVR